jgi:hypothetical protein
MQGLERDPTKRPGTVLEYAKGIEDALSGADGAADKGGLLGVFKGFLRRE